MLSSLFFSALTLASRGVSTVEDIDRSWMGVTYMPMGPFGIMDQVGLSTVWTITDYWAKKMGDPQAQKNADFVKQYVDRGELGYKTSKGFYTYPHPAYQAGNFLAGDEKD
jgi:3-hydroxybutyryl-CoA dehydrogenase